MILYLVDGSIAAVDLLLLDTVRILLRGLDHLDVRHGGLDNDVVSLEIFVGLLVNHQQLGLIGEGLNALDHLLVGLVSYVDLVNLDDPIALSQTSGLTRRPVVHLPDELPVLPFLRVQVEPITVEIVPFHDVAESCARCIVTLRRRHASGPRSVARSRTKRKLANGGSGRCDETDYPSENEEESSGDNVLYAVHAGWLRESSRTHTTDR